MRKQRTKKPGLQIPELGYIEAYAVIVDLNQFTGMVRKAEEVGDGAAQFTRDALTLPIEEIEVEGGEVVAYMGDAFLAVVPEGEGVVGPASALQRQLTDSVNISITFNPEANISGRSLPVGHR